MNLRRLVSVLVLLSFILPATAASNKPILVYYMPWFVAKPFSQQWGWHWTMDHFNPDNINAAGEREIASWYYPMIGPYDSADPLVIEYHVLLMRLAGIDGVIVDWYGADDYLDYRVNNERTKAVLQYARKAGLKFAICYEDRTIEQEVTGKFIQAANAVQHAKSTMSYVETNFFTDQAYLHLNGRPVLLNFGPQYFKENAQWAEILSAFSNKPAFFTEDSRLPIGVGAFNWPPMWLSQAPGTGGVLSGIALQGYLAGFEKSAETWPAFISSAFPRFHDVYRNAGIRDYWGYLGDQNGDTFRETLTRAITNKSSLVQIVSWNDFGEGTAVEPTIEYGYRDLGIVQELRRKHIDPQFHNGTNDLALAAKFYNLRRNQAESGEFILMMDQAFSAIVHQDLVTARQILDRAEKKSLEKPGKTTSTGK